jgi:N-methylhydantoinase A/oxoprolinase/acetone carboxylase beta subunit
VPRRFDSTFAGDSGHEPNGVRPIWDDDARDFVEGAVYLRDTLPPGATVEGPSLIEGMDSTVWIPSGASGIVDVTGNIVISLSGALETATIGEIGGVADA